MKDRNTLFTIIFFIVSSIFPLYVQGNEYGISDIKVLKNYGKSLDLSHESDLILSAKRGVEKTKIKVKAIIFLKFISIPGH